MRAFDIVMEYNKLQKEWDMWFNICSSATKNKEDAYNKMVKACVKLSEFKNKQYSEKK